MLNEDQANHRQFPRREFIRPIGILCRGQYFVSQTQAISEGGLAFISDYLLEVDQMLVLTFQMRDGRFYSVKGSIKNQNKKGHLMVYGIAFVDVSMILRRQIRAHVSEVSSVDTVIELLNS